MPFDTIDPTQIFESHRGFLRGLAYRMLGSRGDAEDVVQDTWLRWRECDVEALREPRAFLARVATNLCLDRLKSAQRQREEYVGVWLPEPLVQSVGLAPSPEDAAERADDLSVAFLLALERLTPLERAAFLLHDIFDMEADDVAGVLSRSPAACRQLVSRARKHVARPGERASLSAEARRGLALAFGQALRSGDMDALIKLLAPEAVFMSDGGGVVTAVPKPLQGAPLVAKVLLGFARLHDLSRQKVLPALINGHESAILYAENGAPVQTMSIAFDPVGRVCAIYVVRNPAKLRHLPSAAQGG